jgi:putative iron transporter
MIKENRKMKILNKFKGIIMAVMALGIFVTIGSKRVYATETDIASGIYEIENDVYHESETGMAMSRTYLLPSMSVEVTKEHVIYTIGFSGSDYMENYRMKVNGEEVPVEILEENSEEGTVKLNVEVDKVDADMAAIIYVGPMERDVEFKVIPKMETLTLVQAIEDEVEEIVPEDESEEVEIEEENLAVVADNEKSSNNVILIIAGVAVVVAIGAVVIVKAKKK